MQPWYGEMTIKEAWFFIYYKQLMARYYAKQ
jgi:hypothetical protein